MRTFGSIPPTFTEYPFVHANSELWTGNRILDCRRYARPSLVIMLRRPRSYVGDHKAAWPGLHGVSGELLTSGGIWLQV